MKKSIWLLLPLIPMMAAATPDEGLDDGIAHALAHRAEEAAAKIRTLEAWSRSGLTASPGQELYDVHHYDLTLDLEPTTRTLTGTGAISAAVVGTDLAELVLDLDAGLSVSACRAGGAPAAFARAGDVLTVTLDRVYAAGETVTVEVDYSGDPSGASFGWSSHGGEPMIWTLSEPFGAREWWPCKDLNTDKADSVDVRVTVPDDLIVASNGLLVSDVDHGARRTFHWRTRYPVATYLVSLAIHPYERFSTWYAPVGGGDPMEIQHFVFADQLAAALTAYGETDEMMDVFVEVYGEYPFVEEKYGHASFTWGGGMEHQTLSSMGGLWEDVISHELAHQWWGDLVTCADFHHIWLNEGFATWSEAYWRERTDGAATYRAYMDAAAYKGPGTIYVEDTGNFYTIFSTDLSYNKASWVVHMLRGVLGDDDFFAGLAAYRDAYGFGSATTEQFRDVMEQVSGHDLDAFFQQWIYGEFFPVYGASWSQHGGTLQLTVRQLQTDAGPFTMPIPVRITTGVGVTDVVVENSLVEQVYDLPVTGDVLSVELDPDDWILCTVEDAVTDPTFERGVLVVNGVDWDVYDDEIRDSYAAEVFWGSHAADFWDLFPEPAGGYPAALPGPLGHGAVPADVLGRYSSVVWVGNNYHGDLEDWRETAVASYLEAGGNLLLLTRMLDEFLDTGLESRLGLDWVADGIVIEGPWTPAAPGLAALTSTGTQSYLDAFDPGAVGAGTTVLFTALHGAETVGMGAVNVPAAGGSHRPDGGRLAVVSGRPYRWEHGALRGDVDFLLSEWFLEPYTPATDAPTPARLPRSVLARVAPNPFNPATELSYVLAAEGTAELAVYDAAGRRIRTVFSGPRPAGPGTVRWDGRDDGGANVATGTYFARLRAAGDVSVRKLTLVR